MSDDLSGLEGSLVYLCARRFTLQLLFYGSVLGLLVNTASLAVVGVDSPTVVVILLNYVGLVALGVFSGAVLWRCGKIDS